MRIINFAENLSDKTTSLEKLDPEKGLLESFVQTVIRSGVCTNSTAVINFYVALKTRPLAILTGPARIGKIAIVQSLARFLTGGDHKDSETTLQCQMMVGHPWSAEKSSNVAFFTEIQTRCNVEKLLGLLEEAWQPQNVHRVFIACLTRISPAELLSFFTEVAFQLRHGELMRLGHEHLSRPIPFPPNLLMIGTMDTDQFDWWDGDMFPSTTIIQWMGNPRDPLDYSSPFLNPPVGQTEFLRSYVRSERDAYRKLNTVLKFEKQPFQILLHIEELFEKHAIALSQAVTGEVMNYLANAWTIQGAGLFDPSNSRNLEIA